MLYRIYDPKKGGFSGCDGSEFFAMLACIEKIDFDAPWSPDDNPFIICSDGRVLVVVENHVDDVVRFRETTLDEVFHEDPVEEVSGRIPFWQRV